MHAQGRRKTHAYDTDLEYDPAFEADADVLDRGRAVALARIREHPELFDPRLEGNAHQGKDRMNGDVSMTDATQDRMKYTCPIPNYE